MDTAVTNPGNYALPKAWGRKRLADLIESRETINPAKLKRKEFLYVDIEALDNKIQQITAPKRLAADDAPSRARVAIRRGDVIFSLVRPYLKNIALVPEGLDGQVASTAFCQLRPKPEIDGRFIFFQLIQDSFISSIPTYGNSPPAARDDEFLDISVVIAPPDVQKAVVGKIEELFSDLDAGVAALKRAQANLKRYRAAVLKAAVEGRLTAEWRAERKAKGIATEPAAKLLERILVERRKKWEAAQLKKYADAGKAPPRGWQGKYPEPVAIGDNDLPDLPTDWRWASLDAVTEIASGVAKGSKQKPGIQLREVPYLRVANVQRGYLDLTEMKTILATERDIEELKLLPGDIFFNEGGDLDKLGRGWVWNGEIDECIHQNHVFRARPLMKEVQPKFISYHGNSFGQKWFLRTGKRSVNLASINMTVLRRFPVPVAPAAEQTEIVSQVEAKLSNIAQAEAEIKRSLERAARLRQAILKRAFEGRLL